MPALRPAASQRPNKFIYLICNHCKIYSNCIAPAFNFILASSSVSVGRPAQSLSSSSARRSTAYLFILARAGAERRFRRPKFIAIHCPLPPIAQSAHLSSAPASIYRMRALFAASSIYLSYTDIILHRTSSAALTHRRHYRCPSQSAAASICPLSSIALHLAAPFLPLH